MAGDDYVSSGGGLKLKGVAGGRIEKKKKKKSPLVEPCEKSTKEDKDTLKSSCAEKTDAQKKFELIRRQRMDERLKDVSAKSHKERVSDLNKYLGSLSDHMDLPKT